MNENEIMIADADTMQLVPQQQPETAALLDTSTDNIIYLAERAEKYIAAMNKIMEAALRITTELDWVLIGGTPYLQESGSTKVARLFGISVQLLEKPTVERDAEGYKTYTYKARFMLKDQFVDCEGSRSMKEDFFSAKGKKKPDEIDERDVKMAAYTNCLNNGIKRLIPNLRNIDIDTLKAAGLDVSRIKGYSFKGNSNGGSNASTTSSDAPTIACCKCGVVITQKVADFSQKKFGEALCMKCQKGAEQ